jgi:hypothetical protein
VHTGLAVAVAAAALLAAASGAVVAVRGRPPGQVTLILAALGALLTASQSVIAAVELVQGRRPPETPTYVGYLVGIVVVLPLAALWALAERTRWSGLVVAVGGVTVAVMTARMVMLWRGAGA